MAPLGLKGKGGALLGILGIRRNQAYSGVIFDGSGDFYAEFIANRGAVRRLPGEGRLNVCEETPNGFRQGIQRGYEAISEKEAASATFVPLANKRQKIRNCFDF